MSLPSGNLTVCYRKSPLLIDKPSISMDHGFHSKLLDYQRVSQSNLIKSPLKSIKSPLKCIKSPLNSIKSPLNPLNHH